MKLEEHELEKIIMNTPNSVLFDKGLEIYGDKQNQLNLGSYGILDILTSRYTDVIDFDNCKISGENLELNLIELKSGEINTKTFLQSIRYLKGISRHIPDVDFISHITLIGTSVNLSESFVYLTDIINTYCVSFEDKKVFGQFFSTLNIYTVSYDVDGIKFIYHSDYCATNEFLNKKLITQ